MPTPHATPAPRFTRERVLSLAPAAAALATLAWIGLRGLVHPVSLLLLLAWMSTGFVLTLLHAPAAVYALFPLAMFLYVDAPLQPFDLVLATLAGILVLPWLSRRKPPELRLNPIEWSYLLFLVCLLTTFAVPHTLRPLIGVAKTYALGLVAYEVARHAVRRFGRPVMLWGMVVMGTALVAMLILRHGDSGVAASQIMNRRTTLTQMSWGSSNYVAAVLVALLPAALALFRTHAIPEWQRRASMLTFAGMLVGLLYTTSRGGFLLGVIVLLGVSRRAWRSPVRLVLGGAIAAGIVLLTPLGTGMIERFSDPQEVFSIAARWAVWEAALQRGLLNLPFGIGHGQSRTFGDELGSIDAHNFPLTIFSEGGPLALAAWLLLMGAVWVRGRRLQRVLATEATGRSLSLLATLGFLNSLFEPTFSGHLYHTIFWWGVGTLDADPVEPPDDPGAAAPTSG